MILRHRESSGGKQVRVLLFLTSALGLVWNAGELAVTALGHNSTLHPLITVFAYSALGFLPSVVVHSVQLETDQRPVLTWIAYLISTLATVVHIWAYAAGLAVPSSAGLILLTFGAVSLVIGLLLTNLRQTVERKTVWVTALLVFAVSSLHLVSHRGSGSSWPVELIAHQSSLPLVLAILYQNYRFAFADIFLKRAVSLILLAFVAFGLYVAVAGQATEAVARLSPNIPSTAIILVFWVGTALLYPSISRFAGWLVDTVLLKRPDYESFLNELAKEIDECESTELVPALVSSILGKEFSAGSYDWREIEYVKDEPRLSSVNDAGEYIETVIRTAEAPFYLIRLGEFAGGRRLLSEEITMLEMVANRAARRIDALRVTHERCEREFREQQFSRLAAEAQLTALRAQINPHFLFNALTTIGYLIQESPDKALQTLLQLTKLLRRVLNTTDEFTSFGAELRLIESYLEIERARFEERLTVTIDVDDELRSIEIPSLILQPLVENAIKHGISTKRSGGEVKISALLENEDGQAFLCITVADTGDGSSLLARPESRGVGLRNVEDRLRNYYHDEARLELYRYRDVETRAVISIPIVHKRSEIENENEVSAI
ncbi:MAG: histidine kinase [Acidobacteria bacterium]|nr:histidine kinase [Acidobacteriota bacterium]